uniref:Uncharacterized protein n=1 Tax=Haptolina ericina TaxID=156174 RepID=A0A7S3FDA0_9EUKA
MWVCPLSVKKAHPPAPGRRSLAIDSSPLVTRVRAVCTISAFLPPLLPFLPLPSLHTVPLHHHSVRRPKANGGCLMWSKRTDSCHRTLLRHLLCRRLLQSTQTQNATEICTCPQHAKGDPPGKDVHSSELLDSKMFSVKPVHHVQ